MEQTNQTLSVIVPIYNAERYLEKCIGSILDQTYDEIEVLLINDGSTDRSGEICDKFAAGDPRVVAVHKQNEGRTAARVDGILRARGEYVTFVDSDDWIDNEMYAALFRRLLEEGADIITSGFCRNEAEENFIDAAEEGTYEGEALKKFLETVIWDGEINKANVSLALWNKIYRKKLILPHVVSVPRNLYKSEDLAYVYAPFMDADKVIVTHDVFYHYRVTAGSVSNRYREDEVSLLNHSYETSRRIYSRYGEGVLQSYDMAITWFWYAHIYRWIDNSDGNSRSPEMVNAQVAELSTTDLFRVQASHIYDRLKDDSEKKVIGLLLNHKPSEAGKYIRTLIRIRRFRETGGRLVRRVFGEKVVQIIKGFIH